MAYKEPSNSNFTRKQNFKSECFCCRCHFLGIHPFLQMFHLYLLVTKCSVTPLLLNSTMTSASSKPEAPNWQRNSSGIFQSRNASSGSWWSLLPGFQQLKSLSFLVHRFTKSHLALQSCVYVPQTNSKKYLISGRCGRCTSIHCRLLPPSRSSSSPPTFLNCANWGPTNSKSWIGAQGSSRIHPLPSFVLCWFKTTWSICSFLQTHDSRLLPASEASFLLQRNTAHCSRLHEHVGSRIDAEKAPKTCRMTAAPSSMHATSPQGRLGWDHSRFWVRTGPLVGTIPDARTTIPGPNRLLSMRYGDARPRRGRRVVLEYSYDYSLWACLVACFSVLGGWPTMTWITTPCPRSLSQGLKGPSLFMFEG